MCGIAGIYGEQQPEAIGHMTATMPHRGPNDEGHYRDGAVSLGHRRLSVMDLSVDGRQPMSNEDGSVWLVVNGEVYNHRELRKELESNHHVFRSRSDSEVIVHLYEDYGAGFVNRIRGMFALAIYDKCRKRLVLARDPIGKKPLYYYHDGRRLVFASEIKAILAAGVPAKVNLDAIPGYLMYQYTIGRHTLFQKIDKVLAGEVWTYDDRDLTGHRYWDIPTGKGAPTGTERDPRELERVLREATRLRMNADVPVGSFLSGGLDSATVTALAVEYSNGPLHTFSIGFNEFSELRYARAVSTYIGTKHHEILVTPEMVADHIRRVAWCNDEPLGDAAIINNYFLSLETNKEHLKVVVAGEGGDELFGGYAHYRIGQAIRPLYHIPARVRAIVARAALPVLGTLGGRVGVHAARLLAQQAFQDAHNYLLQTMDAEEVTELVGAGHDEPTMIPCPMLGDDLNQQLAWDCKNLLPEKFLMKADKGTMANSVEERLPLLDREVIELAFSIPGRCKVSGGWARDWQGKLPLREIARKVLPREIADRKKQGFGTPVGAWMRHPKMRGMIEDRLWNGELSKGMLNRKLIDEMLNGLNHDAPGRLGSHFSDSALWTVFALQLWYDTFFDGGARCAE